MASIQQIEIQHKKNSFRAVDDTKQIKEILTFIKLICFYYSVSPNDTLKKKYYEILSNIPVFYPNEFFTEEYLYILNNNPLSSFLDNREDLLHWCHFMENSILKKLGLQTQNYASWVLDYSHKYEKPYEYSSDENDTHFLYNEYVFYGVILASLLAIIKFNI
jgi:hypothetical protein